MSASRAKFPFSELGKCAITKNEVRTSCYLPMIGLGLVHEVSQTHWLWRLFGSSRVPGGKDQLELCSEGPKFGLALLIFVTQRTASGGWVLRGVTRAIKNGPLIVTWYKFY